MHQIGFEHNHLRYGGQLNFQNSLYTQHNNFSPNINNDMQQYRRQYDPNDHFKSDYNYGNPQQKQVQPNICRNHNPIQFSLASLEDNGQKPSGNGFKEAYKHYGIGIKNEQKPSGNGPKNGQNPNGYKPNFKLNEIDLPNKLKDGKLKTAEREKLKYGFKKIRELMSSNKNTLAANYEPFDPKHKFISGKTVEKLQIMKSRKVGLEKEIEFQRKQMNLTKITELKYKMEKVKKDIQGVFKEFPKEGKLQLYNHQLEILKKDPQSYSFQKQSEIYNSKMEIERLQKSIKFVKDIKSLEKIVDRIPSRRGLGIVKKIISKIIKKYE